MVLTLLLFFWKISVFVSIRKKNGTHDLSVICCDSVWYRRKSTDLCQKNLCLNPHCGSYHLWCITSFSLIIFSSINMELKYPDILCCYEDCIENTNRKCLVWYLAFEYSENVPTFPFFACSYQVSHFGKIDYKGRKHS